MNVYKQLVFCHFLVVVVVFWKVPRCVLFHSIDEDAETWRSCYYRAKPRSGNPEDSRLSCYFPGCPQGCDYSNPNEVPPAFQTILHCHFARMPDMSSISSLLMPFFLDSISCPHLYHSLNTYPLIHTSAPTHCPITPIHFFRFSLSTISSKRPFLTTLTLCLNMSSYSMVSHTNFFFLTHLQTFIELWPLDMSLYPPCW